MMSIGRTGHNASKAALSKVIGISLAKSQAISGPTSQLKSDRERLRWSFQVKRHVSVFAAAVPFLELRIQFDKLLLGKICATLLRHKFLEFTE